MLLPPAARLLPWRQKWRVQSDPALVSFRSGNSISLPQGGISKGLCLLLQMLRLQTQGNTSLGSEAPDPDRWLQASGILPTNAPLGIPPTPQTPESPVTKSPAPSYSGMLSYRELASNLANLLEEHKDKGSSALSSNRPHTASHPPGSVFLLVGSGQGQCSHPMPTRAIRVGSCSRAEELLMKNSLGNKNKS